MPPDHWPAFAAASAVLPAVPGPPVLLVISYVVPLGIGLWRAPVQAAETGDPGGRPAARAGYAF